MERETVKRDDDELLQLHKFAASGDLELCKRFTEEQTHVDLNNQDSLGWTPLMYAARFGHVNILKFLHSKGGSCISMNNFDYTPLCMAVASNCKEAFEYIFEEVKKSKNQLRNEIISFELACVLGRSDFLKSFISLEEFNVNEIECKVPGITPLLLAVYSGNVGTVELLLGAGANQLKAINTDPSALSIAMYNGNDRMQALFSKREKFFSTVTPSFLTPTFSGNNVFTFPTPPPKGELLKNTNSLYPNDTSHSPWKFEGKSLYSSHQSIHLDPVTYDFHHLDGLISPRFSEYGREQKSHSDIENNRIITENNYSCKSIKQVKPILRRKYLSWMSGKIKKRRTKSVNDVREDRAARKNEESKIERDFVLKKLLEELKLEKYLPLFRINEMDSFTIFTLTERDLIAMGITKMEEIANILETLKLNNKMIASI